jgi:hypothetical protein
MVLKITTSGTIGHFILLNREISVSGYYWTAIDALLIV